MKPLTIYAIEGYSASIRTDKTLDDVLNKLIQPYMESIEKYSFNNSKIFYKYDKMNSYLTENPTKNLFLIGKSLGGYNTIKYLNKHIDDLKCYENISILTIDPNCLWNLNSRKKGYIPMTADNIISITNFHQSGSRPTGAQVTHAFNIDLTSDDVNHFNITNNPVVHSYINDTIKKLII